MGCIFLEKPVLPYFGLDPSWAMGMEWAVAHGMRIGQDVIFTFGPYASIYTHLYNPETVSLQTGGGVVLALSYSAIFMYLGCGRLRKIGFFLLIFVVGLIYRTDAMFLVYPFFLSLYVQQYLGGVKSEAPKPLINEFSVVPFSLLCIPLGLLPLIKGSFGLACVCSSLAMMFYLIYRKRWAMVAGLALVPALTLIVAWLVAGQPFNGLYDFVVSMVPVISGYTDAMSLDFFGEPSFFKSARDVAVYVVLSVVMLFVLVKSSRQGILEKFYLLAVAALFLLVVFKATFVRHGDHPAAAAVGLLYFGGIVGFLATRKAWIVCLLLGGSGFYYIADHDGKFAINKWPEIIKKRYADGLIGVYSRFVNASGLNIEYEDTIAAMKQKNLVPLLPGSSDIYSYGQADLLVSGNLWSPRPVIQSYSAYTQGLAEKNSNHLRTANRPDNIFFRLEPIDGRLPSLEDGVSWVAMRDNYDAIGMVNGMAVLRKRDNFEAASRESGAKENTYDVSQDVDLSTSGAPLFLSIDLELTPIGRVLSALFKPPPLALELTFSDGNKEEYRVIAGMMRSGFFVSPRVRTTGEFYLLQSGNTRYLPNAYVRSFKMKRPVGGGIFWNTSYKAKVFEYAGRSPQPLSEDFFTGKFVDGTGVPTTAGVENCDGAIDSINDGLSNAAGAIDAGLFSINGWLAESGINGTVPPKMFVVLTDNAGKRLFATPKITTRDDVKMHFGHPEMPDAGYALFADSSGLAGSFTVGLAKIKNEQLVMCQFQKSITISQQQPTYSK